MRLFLLAAEIEEMAEPLRVVEEPVFWEQFWGGSSVILAILGLLFGLVVLVMWVVVPFLVNGIYENVKAMRKGLEEERLAAASQRAAQLTQLKLIAQALNGAEITTEVEEPVPMAGPQKVKLLQGR